MFLSQDQKTRRTVPLPKTKSVGTILRFLKKEKPGMSREQMIAIALSKTGKSKNKVRNTAMKHRGQL